MHTANHGNLPYRRGRRAGDNHPDPYREVGKHAGATVCPKCHVVQEGGQWHWGRAPEQAGEVTCPACRRAHDRFAAHVVHLRDVPVDHRTEILGQIYHLAEMERREHPLERLMQLREEGNHLEVATTGVHLARRLMANLLRTWRNKVKVHHGGDRTLMQWHG